MNELKALSHFPLDINNSMQTNEIFYGFQSIKTHLYWFSSKNGISSFDGKKFTLYEKSNPYYGVPTIKLIEDEFGLIWFYTSSGDVAYFDGTKYITPIISVKIKNNIRKNNIKDIWIDESNNIFIIVEHKIESKISLYKVIKNIHSPDKFEIKECRLNIRISKNKAFCCYFYSNQEVALFNLKDRSLYLKVYKNYFYSKGEIVEFINQKIVKIYTNFSNSISCVQYLNEKLFVSTTASLIVLKINGRRLFDINGYNVSSVFYDLDTNFFILTQNDGVLFKLFKSDYSKMLISNAGILNFKFHKNKIYFTDNKYRLNIFDLKSGKLKFLKNRGNRILDKTVFASSNKIFFNKTCYEINTEDKREINYLPFQFISTKLFGFDSFYLSTGYADVKMVDENDNLLKTLYYGERVYDCILEKSNVLWIATKNGLLKSNLDFKNSNNLCFFKGYQTNKIKIIEDNVFAIVNKKNICFVNKNKATYVFFKGSILENKIINDYLFINKSILIVATNNGLFKVYLDGTDKFNVIKVILIRTYYDRHNDEVNCIDTFRNQLYYSIINKLNYIDIAQLLTEDKSENMIVYSLKTNLKIYLFDKLKTNQTFDISCDEHFIEFNLINSYLNKLDQINQYKYQITYNNEILPFRYISTNELRFENFKHGSYKLKIQSYSIYKGWSSPYIIFFKIEPKFEETISFTIFFLLILIFIFALITFVIVRINKRRLKFIELTYELENNKLHLLKSQLNPHFLFNSLNSLKSLIYFGNKDISLLYLDKMSFFLRDVLKLNHLVNTDIKNEIRLVTSYLDVEKIRLGDLLNYKIICDSFFFDHCIPSNILQPIVENSIKYSLCSKESEPLNIIIEIFIIENIINISVTDNSKLKGNKTKTHDSFSLTSISKRLDNFNKFKIKEPIVFQEIFLNGKKNGAQTIVKIVNP